jgi:hypothetical protein
MYLKHIGECVRAEANQLVPLFIPLFFGWTIPLVKVKNPYALDNQWSREKVFSFVSHNNALNESYPCNTGKQRKTKVTYCSTACILLSFMHKIIMASCIQGDKSNPQASIKSQENKQK